MRDAVAGSNGDMASYADELRKLGARVRRFREGGGWSRERLSETSGLHPTYVGAIERGERNPTLLTLSKLAKGLGVTVADLLDSTR